MTFIQRAMRWRTATIALLTLALTACSFNVKLVGDYDQITDQSIHDLQTSTAAFFGKAQQASDAGALDAGFYASHQDFFAESRGGITALQTRAEVLEEGAKAHTLTQLLTDLELQFEDLER